MGGRGGGDLTIKSGNWKAKLYGLSKMCGQLKEFWKSTVKTYENVTIFTN